MPHITGAESIGRVSKKIFRPKPLTVTQLGDNFHGTLSREHTYRRTIIMKFLFLFIALSVISALPSQATTHTVTAVGFTFSPSSLTITAGDTVIFSISGIHNAVEVSQATWDANGTTPLGGGFSLPLGGGSVVLTVVGTHWYVCQPHASSGMKGIITVNPTGPPPSTIT